MTTDKQAKDTQAVLDAIANMNDEDRPVAERLHEVIMMAAPNLMPRTWYGMPAYSNGDKIVLFVRVKAKFGERYVTIGFNDVAKLDDGNLWAHDYALAKLGDAEAVTIAELVKKAIG